MIFLPSRGRPQQLLQVADAYKAMNTKAKVLVILDEDDAGKYETVRKLLPQGFNFFINKKSMDLNAALEAAYRAYPNEPFYGMGSDDCFPRTDGWDMTLAGAAFPHNLAWGDDGLHGPNLPTHPFLGGQLARAFGWLIPPYTKRGYIDFTWLDYGRALNVCKYCPSVKTEHLHWQIVDKETGKRKGKFDATYASQPSVVADKIAWQAHRSSLKFKEDLERIKKTLEIV
jgi:hypothetical protein